jgi:hypothetical protein
MGAALSRVVGSRRAWLRFFKAQMYANGALLLVFGMAARFAALRGSRRKRMPVLVDKLLRALFLGTACVPSLALHPLLSRRARVLLTIALMLYTPYYLDGAEQHGGRPSKHFRRKSNWLWRGIMQRYSLKVINIISIILFLLLLMLYTACTQLTRAHTHTHTHTHRQRQTTAHDTGHHKLTF